MTIIVLTHCPVGLRGFLTRWLLEISPGVFLGNPSARIRDALWDEVRQYAGNGRALLAYSTNSEQGYTFRTHATSGIPSTTRASPSSSARQIASRIVPLRTARLPLPAGVRRPNAAALGIARRSPMERRVSRRQ